MKKSTKKFTSTLLAAASVAGVIVPATQVLAEEKMTVEKAQALVDYAKKEKNFAEYNIAYAAILQLDKSVQDALLAELAPLYKDVVTADVQKALDILTTVAKDLDLGSYYDAMALIEKEVPNARNVQYLLGELTSWGQAGVFTAEVVAATDAIGKLWEEATEANEKAAIEAIAKVKNAKSLAWLNVELENAAKAVVRKLDVKSVSAITNAKVQVVLNEEVKSVDPAVFTIVDKDGKNLEIKSAVLSEDGKTITLNTAAQTPYSLYTLKTAEVALTFVGLPVDSTKPTATATVDSFQTVKVTFSEVVDASTAKNIANYAIDNNLTVLKAELDSTGKVVTLTTVPQSVGVIYTITIQNVTDLAGNAIDKTTNYFGGLVKDTSYLVVSTATVDDYNKVKVVFNKKVDVASATNIVNYVIDNNLTVLKAEIDAADTTGKTVVLTTAEQTVGTIYKITINNVKDTLENGMKEAVSNYFGGMAKDLSKPSALVSVADSNKVTVTFDKKVDKATAENIANYSVDNNLVVVKAVLGTDEKTVTLTTSEQAIGQIYKIVIQNIKTIYGTSMDKSEQYFAGLPEDVTGPTYSISSNSNKVFITYNEDIDAASATALSNYAFDGGLGYPVSAVIDKTLDPSGRTVVLTTGPQTAGKVYYVTVANVKDVNGNVISTTNDANKKAFIGQATSVGAVVKYQAASIVNSNTIDLVFDTEITTTTGLNVSIDKVTGVTNPGLTYTAEIQANKKIVRVQFKTTASNNPDLFTAGVVYAATVTGVANLEAPVTANNNNAKAFAGTNVVNAVPEIKAVVPVDSTTVKVVFTEPVTGITSGSFTVDNGAVAGVSVSHTDVVSEVLVYLSSPTTAGTIYKLRAVSGAFTDSVGYNNGKVVDSNNVALVYQFAGTNVANVKPGIKAVVPVDMYNFDIVFTEAVDKTDAEAAVYTVTNVTDNVALAIATKTLSADGTTLRVTLNKGTADLKAGKIYKVITSSVIKDLAGLAMDVASTSTTNVAQFAGTNVVNAIPEIVAVVGDATNDKITVVFSEKVVGTINQDDFVVVVDGTTLTLTGATLAADGKTVTITSSTDFAAGKLGTVKVATGSDIADINNQAAKTDAVTFGTKETP